MKPLEPGDLLDRYTIESLVARGGMATVFRATDIETGLPVALKIPHPEVECDPVFFERFQREAELGRELKHPGVIRVLPKTKSKSVYFAAEWAEGHSLRSVIDARPHVETAVGLALQLCDVLQYLHGQGIAHRDLKPENIIVGATAKITLLDFGLAGRPGARRITFGKFSRLMGSADYISPEQLRGKRGDARSDIYSFGVILCELLSGRVPFEGVNPFLAMNQRLIAEPCLDGVPEHFHAILLCALARDPRRRYVSIAELEEDLRRPVSSPNALRATLPPAPRKSVLLSLAMIPAGILLLLLYVASHQ